MSRVVVAERAFKIYRLCEDSRGGGSVSTIYTRHFTTVDTVCRLPTLSRHTPSPHTHSQSLTRVVACVCRPPAPPHPTPITAISVMEQQGRLCRQDRDPPATGTARGRYQPAQRPGIPQPSTALSSRTLLSRRSRRRAHSHPSAAPQAQTQLPQPTQCCQTQMAASDYNYPGHYPAH